MSIIGKEFKDIKDNFKQLDFKVSYIFLSIAVITFISIAFASTTFYYNNIGTDRFDSRVYWFCMDGALMFILPILSIKLVFKQKLSDYGLQLGDWKYGLTTTAIFFVFMIAAVWIVSGSESFANTYPQGGSKVKDNLGIFLFYELCVAFYMLGWEFFWRGYMLFGLFPKFGWYSIFIQMIPFFILHKGKPELELFGSILAGLILGVQAIRARSFIYAWIIHALVMVCVDGISVLRAKSGIYGINITDFFKVITSIFR